MDLPPTQLYDDDFLPTQKITYGVEEEEEVTQVGILTVNSVQHPIHKGINKIGRHPSSNIVLNDETVSKFHAEIEAGLGPGSTFVCDLGSSNKTKLNKAILRPKRAYQLKDGDVIELGKVSAIYTIYRLNESTIPDTPKSCIQGKNHVGNPKSPYFILEESTLQNEDCNRTSMSPTSKKEESHVFLRPPASSLRYSAETSTNDSAVDSSIFDEQNEPANTSDVDVSEMETQKFAEHYRRTSYDIHEEETQKFVINKGENKTEKVIHDIHMMITQKVESIHDAESKNDLYDVNTQEEESIHDKETQRFQVYDGRAKTDIEDNDIHDAETQKIDYSRIDPDMKETKAAEVVDKQSEASNNHEEHMTNKTEMATVNNTTRELEEPVQSDDCEIKRNTESPDILKNYAYHDIDSEVIPARPSTPERPSTIKEAQKNPEENDQEYDIFDAPTQRITHTSKPESISSDSETDEEGVFQNYRQNDQTIYKPSADQTPCNDDSATDDEGHLKKNSKEQSGALEDEANKSGDGSESNKSAESIDLFEVITQQVPAQMYTDAKDSAPNKSLEPAVLTEDIFCALTQIKGDVQNEDSAHNAADNGNENFNISPTQIMDEDVSEVPKSDIAKSSHYDDKIPADVDDMAPTQLMDPLASNGDENVDDHDAPIEPTTSASASPKDPGELNSKSPFVEEANITRHDVVPMEIDDTAPTQLANVSQPSEFIKASTPELENDEDDNRTRDALMREAVDTPPLVIDENGSTEDLDYEMAPTQLLEDFENEKRMKAVSTRNVSTVESKRKTGKKRASRRISLNDTVERNLNDLFDGANEEKVEDPPQISTQYLESVLQESQTEDSPLPKVGKVLPTENVSDNKETPQSPSVGNVRRRRTRKFKGMETESDSQEKYFSRLRTGRKRHVFSDSQGSVDTDINDAIPSSTVIDDNNITTLCTSGKNKDNLKDKGTTDLKASEESQCRISGATKKSSEQEANEADSEATSAPSNDLGEDKGGMQKSYDSDEDLLSGLPAVKIYGTVKTPASPSGSSTSTVHEMKPIKRVAKGRTRRTKAAPNKTLLMTFKPDVEEEPYRSVKKTDSPKFVQNTMNIRSTKRGIMNVEDHDDSDEDFKKITEVASRILTVKKSSAKKRKEEVIANKEVDKSQGKGQASIASLNDRSDSVERLPARATRSTRQSGKRVDESDHAFQIPDQVPPKKAPNKERNTKEGVINERKRTSTVRSLDENENSSRPKKRKAAETEEKTLPTASVKSKRRNTKSVFDTVKESNSMLNFLTKNNTTRSTRSASLVKTSTINESASNSSINDDEEQNVSLKSRLNNLKVIHNDQPKVIVETPSPPKRAQNKRKQRIVGTKKPLETSVPNESSLSETDLHSDSSSFCMSFATTPSTTRRSASSLSITSSPSTGKCKVLFTGLQDNDYIKIVKSLGGTKVEDPTRCTVLVTDKVRRTAKFLCALAQGLPIVSVEWLKESQSAGQFLDWEGYALKDPAAEAKFGFKLRKSLEKAKQRKLLDGYTVILTRNLSPPPVPELKSMITSCGGKVLIRPPANWANNTIIMSSEEDIANAKKILSKAPGTVSVQSTEFILTGILRQELDFVKYRLV